MLEKTLSLYSGAISADASLRAGAPSLELYYDGVAADVTEPEYYVTGGGKWGPSGTFGSMGGTVTWSIAGSGWSNGSRDSTWFSGPTVALAGFLSFDYEAVLTQAFAAWSSVANINFVRVSDGGGDMGVGSSAMIRISGGFMDGRPSGSSILAGAWYPATAGNAQNVAVSGDIIFDSGEGSFWTPDSFLAVATHEIGHSIGLGHTTIGGSLMEPYYNSAITTPQADDIAGAQAVYGTRSGGHAVAINDVTFTEGSAGTRTAIFTVTRTGGTGQFAVNYATVNGSALADSDYVAASGTVWFGSGDPTQTISVTINGDTAIEQNETLFVSLSGATGGVVINDGVGIGTIADDDNIDDYADSFTDFTAPFGQVAVNGSAAGRIEVAGDRDWFQIQLNAGATYTIALQAAGAGLGTLSDAYLRLYGAAGQLIREDDDSGLGLDSVLSYTPTTSGTYYLSAGGFADTRSGTYRLSVAGQNAAPSAAISDHSLDTNEWSTVSGWLSYSDPDGNPATQYQFWDSGAGSGSGYFWAPGNPHHPAGTALTVSAADLGNVWVRGGQAGGSETMWVRAFDGTDWSAWDPFTLTTLPNTPPVAAASDHSLVANEWSTVASWLSYSDADGNPATQYQFWDSGDASDSGYFWTPDNPHHAAGTEITVSAADLGNVWVRGGQTGGSETMWVRAFDGTDWSDWDSFAFTTVPNTPPVAAASDHSLGVNEWSAVSGWISYSDADGHPATHYEFWDSGLDGTSGYFWTPDNARHSAGSGFTVAAADLTGVWVRGGQVTGGETMWVRAFDGTDWSGWDPFTLTTV